MRDGRVVVVGRDDVAGHRLKVGSIAAVDITVVDVEVRVAVHAQVLVQHPEHVRQQFQQLAELKVSQNTRSVYAKINDIPYSLKFVNHRYNSKWRQVSAVANCPARQNRAVDRA